MTDREKLIEMLCEAEAARALGISMEGCADHLIAHGVVVREKGEWVNNSDEYPECNRCGYMPQYDPIFDDIYYSDFCPNCGADMRKGENDG